MARPRLRVYRQRSSSGRANGLCPRKQKLDGVAEGAFQLKISPANARAATRTASQRAPPPSKAGKGARSCLISPREMAEKC